MLKIQQEKSIKFITVERPNASIVLAFLVVKEGEKIIYISEPRIAKVIPKVAVKALPAPKVGILLLEGPISLKEIGQPILSPFAREFFATSSGVPTSLFARPPTLVN
jgi:hypothetical protein